MTTQIPTWRDQSSPGPPTGDPAPPGTLVGERYALRTPIGHGGMGTVWRASDTLLRRDVAVKEVLLPPAMPQAERDALCERTLREARAAAALSHPSVVQVYDVVTDGGRPWIVMELLEARSLADIVIDDGPLSQRTVAKIGIAMLGALEVAHAAGVLHRDVKPANVLICTDGRCVLTDFGVARLPTESQLTTPGMVLGSPHFISPERAVGGTFGPPSDLFSLGVTLYTAVEGGPPFDRGDPFETMRAVVEEPPRPARLAGPLETMLFGLLEKEPANRWRVDDARSVLRELLGGPLRRSGASHVPQDTDPHAVVRPPTEPLSVVRQAGQVGGRAMLDPNEPLTGQLARLRNQGVAPQPLHGTDTWHPPDPKPPRRAPTGRRGAGTRRAPSRSAAIAGDVAGRVRALRRQAPDRVRALSQRATRGRNRARLIVGAGLVAVLALAAVGAVGLFGDSGRSPSPRAAGSATPSATDVPLIAVQEFRHDGGLLVNVPKGWDKVTYTSGTYVDFTDPVAGDARKARINVENYSGTAQKYLQTAENGLKSGRCASPYQRVAMHESQLGGQPSAELEYVCGTGDAMRHGVWSAAVVDGKVYHFYLTVPDRQFAESKVIFEEMVRSARLAV